MFSTSHMDVREYTKTMSHHGNRLWQINPYRAGTELTRFNYVNIMAADALAPYVARTSAAMILVM